jgi:hypothetical protein
MTARFRKNRACPRYNSNVTKIPHKLKNQRVEAPENTSAINIERTPKSKKGNTFFIREKTEDGLINIPLTDHTNTCLFSG